MERSKKKRSVSKRGLGHNTPKKKKKKRNKEDSLVVVVKIAAFTIAVV